MDRASQVLAQSLPPNVPRTYAVLSDRGNVPVLTLCHRKHGRRSKEEVAESRQYLTTEEEKALVKFVSVPNRSPSIQKQAPETYGP
jgi:hypothetical protein